MSYRLSSGHCQWRGCMSTCLYRCAHVQCSQRLAQFPPKAGIVCRSRGEISGEIIVFKSPVLNIKHKQGTVANARGEQARITVSPRRNGQTTCNVRLYWLQQYNLAYNLLQIFGGAWTGVNMQRTMPTGCQAEITYRFDKDAQCLIESGKLPDRLLS